MNGRKDLRNRNAVSCNGGTAEVNRQLCTEGTLQRGFPGYQCATLAGIAVGAGSRASHRVSCASGSCFSNGTILGPGWLARQRDRAVARMGGRHANEAGRHCSIRQRLQRSLGPVPASARHSAAKACVRTPLTSEKRPCEATAAPLARLLRLPNLPEAVVEP